MDTLRVLAALNLVWRKDERTVSFHPHFWNRIRARRMNRAWKPFCLLLALGLLIMASAAVPSAVAQNGQDEVSSPAQPPVQPDPDLEMLDPGMSEPETIEDITGTVRMLEESAYKPAGATMTLDLDEALEVAMMNNPQIRIARSGVLQSLQDLELTKSAYRGLFDVSSRFDETIRTFEGGQFRIDPERGLISEDAASTENNELFSVGPRYRQTFDNGASIELNPSFEFENASDGQFDRTPTDPQGNQSDVRGRINMSFNFPINSAPREQVRTDLENARISTLQTDYDRYLQEEQIRELVINNYWQIKSFERQLEIQNERLLQAMQIEFIRRTQYEFEQASQLQVGEAQIDVLNQQSQLISQEGALEDAIEQFNILLGLPLETRLNLTDALEVEPLPYAPAEYISLVTSTNLELEQLRLQIRQTENNLRVAALGQQPELSFISSYSRTDEGGENIGFGMVFNWNFGDGGATRARVRALQESLEQQQIQLWNLKRNLIQETYADLRELQLQDKRIVILEENVEQSERTYENALFNFREFGQISFRDMQDFQIDLANSRVSLVNAKVQYRVARSSLMQKVHDFEPYETVAPVMTRLTVPKLAGSMN